MNTKMIDIKIAAKAIGIDDAEVLSYRQNGQKVFEYIKKDLDLMPEPGKFIISFKDVLVCDISFVDEVIINAIDYIKEKDMNNQFIVTEATFDVIDNIHAALLLRIKKEKSFGNIKYNSHVLSLTDSNLEMIGDLESNLEETYDFIKQKKELTARDLAGILNLPINSASNRLKKLYDYRLVLRTQITDAEGKYFKYFI